MKEAMIFTRIGYCPHCEKQKRPLRDQWFLAFGQGYGHHDLRASRNGVPGFTPHIYQAELKNQTVSIWKVCSMFDCGTEWKKIDGIWKLSIIPTRIVIEKYSLESFKGLIFWKNDEQYWI